MIEHRENERLACTRAPFRVFETVKTTNFWKLRKCHFEPLACTKAQFSHMFISNRCENEISQDVDFLRMPRAKCKFFFQKLPQHFFHFWFLQAPQNHPKWIENLSTLDMPFYQKLCFRVEHPSRTAAAELQPLLTRLFSKYWKLSSRPHESSILTVFKLDLVSFWGSRKWTYLQFTCTTAQFLCCACV